MKKTFLAALAVSLVTAGASFGATVSGQFLVQAVNAVGLSGNQSNARLDDYFDAIVATGTAFDNFSYTGALELGTYTQGGNPPDTTTIAQWLATGGGTVSSLDPTFGALQLSAPDISKGTATSTFFLFSVNQSPLPVTPFVITHDDGVGVYENGVLLGGNPGPTVQTVSTVGGYSGGVLDFLYVATNGDPSVLKVAAVPLPAGLSLLLLGLGGLAVVRKRKSA